MSKREKRRQQRELDFGPERKIVERSESQALLECGHLIINPPVSKTVNMHPPKFYRCGHCRDENII